MEECKMTRIEGNVRNYTVMNLATLYYMEIIKALKDDFPAEYEKHRNDFPEKTIEDIMVRIQTMGHVICNGYWGGIKKNSPYYPHAMENEAFEDALGRVESYVKLGLERNYDGNGRWYREFKYEKDGKEIVKRVEKHFPW